MIDLKKILGEEGEVRKFGGVAPEGFVLVHEKTLEDLKNFDVWKMWINNETSIKELNISNFDNQK